MIYKTCTMIAYKDVVETHDTEAKQQEYVAKMRKKGIPCYGFTVEEELPNE